MHDATWQGMRRMLPAAAVVAALCALAVLARPAAPAQAASPTVKFATTGNHSELIETVRITRTVGAEPRVAMSLGPQRLPTFQAGDRLDVVAEVQVSTTCIAKGSHCIGQRYAKFNPFVRAHLVLADSDHPAAAAVPLGKPQVVRCTNKRPQRNHHCTIAFRPGAVPIPDPGALPCPPDACFVNLIVSADHRKAKTNNVIVLGDDKPGGQVKGDKGRIAATVLRTSAPAPLAFSDTTLNSPALPLKNKRGTRFRVVHSVAVPGLEADDVIRATGAFRVGIKSLRFKRKRKRYNAFLGTKVILAETPGAVQPAGVAREVGMLGGNITEFNGFNCTQKRSGYRTPCTVEKAGALRLTDDAVNQQGNPRTLYVNLVSRAKPLLSRATRGHKGRLRVAGGLQVVRYPGNP